MSRLRLIVRWLAYHGRSNLAVACGVAVAAAVLTGALLVGDSMRGSLLHLALDRLGRIDEVLASDRFFRTALVEELAADRGFRRSQGTAVPAMLLPATVQTADAPAKRVANRVQAIGCTADFWALGNGEPGPKIGPREAVLNRTLADILQVAQGQWIVVRLPRFHAVPADSPLGRKQETVEGHRIRVGAIVPDRGLGCFSLQPSQQQARNIFLPLDWLQDRVDRAGRANAVLVAGPPSEASPLRTEDVLERPWQPALEDYGFHLRKTARGYFDFSSERLLIDPAAERAVIASLAGRKVQPAITYLANTIACGNRELPYSTIAGVDFTAQPPLGPLTDSEGKPIGPIADDQIVLNRWAADDLAAGPGDRITVRFFEPESTHGEVHERSAEFRLAAVAQMAGAADDPAFTPDVPGLTDRRTIADWDPPFPFDSRRIRPKDDEYWQSHQATPKAFVSLATGRRLWGSRFGQTTTIRVDPAGGTLAELEKQIPLPPHELGFVFQPVRRQVLTASVGTTPFSVLFLGFSSFLIAAAVMLVVLLFRLGVDARASQLGVLLATGFSRRSVTRLLAAEGLCVAALGSLLGVPAGVAYAGLMVWGMRTIWLSAVGTPFLHLYVTALSLAIGLLCGLVVAGIAILGSVRRVAGISPCRLLVGESVSEGVSGLAGRRGRGGAWLELGVAGLMSCAVVALAVLPLDDATRAGGFFAAGGLALVTLLWLLGRHLRAGRRWAAVAAGRGNWLRLAFSNAARNPGRSILTIGLMAAACFLVISVSAFRRDPSGNVPKLQSGDGGFALVCQSDQPLYHDLNTPEGRASLGFSAGDSRQLADCTTIAVRVRSGDDASCLNLYRPRQPRVLGVPEHFIERGGFAWQGSAAVTPEEKANPWLLLLADLGRAPDGVPRVPVVLEKNTAMYSLQLWGGVGSMFDLPDGRGGVLRLEIVGLLDDSIFQGDVLMSQEACLRHFPEVNGYREFLVETRGDAGQVQRILETSLADYGFSAATTGQRLAAFLAVQNTYLSTFQSLGGLGLLLGTLGLAAVQVRNVLQRWRELALLRATGFTRRQIRRLVLLENGVLLAAGLGAGVLAALIAVAPQWRSGGASIPWAALGATLAFVFVAGLAAGALAVRAAAAAPFPASLSRET